MDTHKAYKVSAKRADTGKWWTFGNMKVNQYDNWSMGLKVTDELIALIESKKGGYVNFSFFEDDKAKKQKPHNEAKQDGYQSQDLGDQIPF